MCVVHRQPFLKVFFKAVFLINSLHILAQTNSQGQPKIAAFHLQTIIEK